MTLLEIELVLRTVMLGPAYGGPSISLEEGKFVLYDWGDGPVGMDILAEGDTLVELIVNYKART